MHLWFQTGMDGTCRSPTLRKMLKSRNRRSRKVYVTESKKRWIMGWTADGLLVLTAEGAEEEKLNLIVTDNAF